MLTRRKPLQSKSLFKQRKPLRTRKRARPVAIQRYWDSLPDVCEACWELGVTRMDGLVVHHILADAPGKKGRRDDMLVCRLCPACHNMHRISVHLLGSEAAFERETGVDLVEMAVRHRDAWEASPHWPKLREMP